jgi:hypothetical protein
VTFELVLLLCGRPCGTSTPERSLVSRIGLPHPLWILELPSWTLTIPLDESLRAC